jgi:hypothetical protein
MWFCIVYIKQPASYLATSGHFGLMWKHPQIFAKYDGSFALRALGLVFAISVEKPHKQCGSSHRDA